MPIHAHDPRTYAIIGAAQEVHRVLHRGLFENIYCQALAIEFELRGLLFEAQVPCQLKYKTRKLTGFHHMDFVCFGGVVVEVKAVSGLTPADDAQVLNYLALSGHTVGLLLNFGERSLAHKRLVLGYQQPP
jgi:GxxExxY protein